jgi:hypothetical protein
MGALSFWRTAEERGDALYISPASHSILRRLSEFDEVRILLNAVGVLLPARYHARWARRVRETTGLTREDAALIALATFGTDEASGILGVRYFVTHDQALIAGYRVSASSLHRRLSTMAVQLSTPYNRATLPEIRSPEEFNTA